MSRSALAVSLVLCGWAAQAQTPPPPPKLVLFDAPGAGTASFQGTYPQRINLAGFITGSYVDSNSVYHGFLRTPGGDIISVDVPGASTTRLANLNDLGVLAGEYVAGKFQAGFVRTANGAFTSFHVPDAPATYVSGINDQGEIAGSYSDLRGVYHGYVRAPDGTITIFDAPGAGDYPRQGTSTSAINTAGTVVGFYIDATGVSHGFIRGTDGTFTTFEAPNAGTSRDEGTSPTSINPEGEIVGFYTDDEEGTHGFLRTPDGTITSIDFPAPDLTGTFANAINAAGVIIGTYLVTINANLYTYAFVRSNSGVFKPFSVPGSGFYGTDPVGINAFGLITGSFPDAAGNNHGFLIIP